MATRSTPIAVTVTPIAQHGNNVDWNIAGPPAYVTDNAIFLPAGVGEFDITFTLPTATALTWRASPFANGAGRCPVPGGGPSGQFSVTNVTAKTMTVHSTDPGRRGVAHYRLNFNGGATCDPIIING